jgi:pimeloyl-ACP methyl ester carboxylesterase
MNMSRMTVRGCELAYELLGDPSEDASDTPFVWGHGLSSSRADEDRRPLINLAQIAECRPVVRYDGRGHGESGDVASPQQGDWAELALDQIELMDQLGLGEVALGGASMGTATALHAALRLGGRVRKLILVIPPTAWESRRAQVELYEQMASILEAKGVEPLIQGLRMVPPPDPFVGDDEWLGNRTEALRRADPERLAAVFRGAAVADLPPPEEIETIVSPTLILAWTGDPGHPVSTAEQLGQLLPNSELAFASTADELATWTDRSATFLGR